MSTFAELQRLRDMVQNHRQILRRRHESHSGNPHSSTQKRQETVRRYRAEQNRLGTLRLLDRRRKHPRESYQRTRAVLGSFF